MKHLLFLFLVGIALSSDMERDLQSVYAKSDYDRVLNACVEFPVNE